MLAGQLGVQLRSPAWALCVSRGPGSLVFGLPARAAVGAQAGVGGPRPPVSADNAPQSQPAAGPLRRPFDLLDPGHKLLGVQSVTSPTDANANCLHTLSSDVHGRCTPQGTWGPPWFCDGSAPRPLLPGCLNGPSGFTEPLGSGPHTPGL